MADLSAEQFLQRAFDVGLLNNRQLDALWGELGSRDAPLDDMLSLVMRREFLTNWQVERLVENKKQGYLYGNYKVLYSIGAGTFARVYRCSHIETNEVVAVKVLRQRFSEDMVKTEQFLREASVVKPLKHPNIVPIHEVTSERGRYYMVMDFVEGQNLREFMKVHKSLTQTDAVRITTDIAAGLDCAFKNGVTHRDMKLSNVLLSSRGRGRLVDFGLAAYDGKITDDALANVSNARSIDYAALERASGVRKDDKRSDIFFLGCMFYQMLCGEPPLSETRDRMQRMNVTRFQEIKPISTYLPTLPHRIVGILNKSMELKAEDRYQTPGEMLEELKAAAKSLAAGETSAAPGASADAPNAAAPVQATESNEGESYTVMVVESNAPLQNALRDRLKKLGYRVLVIADPARALARFEFDDTAADCVVFGTGELGVQALEAFNQFAEDDNSKDVPAVLLVDQKQTKQAAGQAALADHRVIVSMPLKFRELRTAVHRLIAERVQRLSEGT